MQRFSFNLPEDQNLTRNKKDACKTCLQNKSERRAVSLLVPITLELPRFD